MKKRSRPFVTDERAVEAYLRRNLRRLYPEATAFVSLRLHPVRTTLTAKSHVSEYDVRLRTNRGVHDALLIGSLDTRGGKAHAFRILRHLWTHGFDRGPFRVPRPLAYDRRQAVLLYEGFRGVTLRNLLERRHPTFGAWLAESGAWLARFHSAPTPAIARRSATDDESVARLIQKTFRRRAPEQRHAVEQSLRFLLRERRRIAQSVRLTLVHQDPHVSNFLISENPRTICGLDFTDTRRYDPAADVGQYLVHLDSALLALATPRRIRALKADVLRAYRRHAGRRLGPDFSRRVNLHQAWACYQFWEFSLAYFPARNRSAKVRQVLDRYAALAHECEKAVKENRREVVK